MGCITADGWRLAAPRIDPLNARDVAQHPVSRVSCGTQKEPRYSGQTWRLSSGNQLAGYLASILEPPGGTGRMPPNRPAALIAKLRLGSLEGPHQFSIRVGLTNIDLESGSVGAQNNFVAARSSDGVGHGRSRIGLSVSKS
jgi:hypothetical protein